VLQLSIVIAAGLFAFYIIPALTFETESLAISVSYPTVLQPVLVAFFLACSVIAAIVGWRGWLLYGKRHESD